MGKTKKQTTQRPINNATAEMATGIRRDDRKVELSEGFQTAEFMLEHGLIDMIVHRKDLRSEIVRLIDYYRKWEDRRSQTELIARISDLTAEIVETAKKKGLECAR